MLLAIPVAVGLLLGKLTGGSFKNLAATPLRAPWIFLTGFLFQVALFNPLTVHQAWDVRYGHALYVASLAALFAGLAINIPRLRWPILVLSVGAGLNLLIVAANGGAMPVDARQLAKTHGPAIVKLIREHRYASNVIPAGAGTRLSILDDHITIPSPLFAGVYSIGDLLIGLGGALLIVAEMHAQRGVASSRRRRQLTASVVAG
ncbi:MAG TPA: DUF5317 family protein [Chloroflexota bacterium]|nr:DUF5317 family protein [Chloroflexota bacterium]